MKKAIFIVSGIVAVSVAGIAMSQNADRKGMRGGFMDGVDTDGNGTIEKSEFEAMLDQRYSATDTNGDGITLEEYEAKIAADREAWRAKREEMRAQREAEREAKREEMETKRAERTKKRFESMDADGNGTISAEEYKMAGDKMFDRMDRNDDGILNDRRGRGGKHRHRRGRES